MYIKSMSGADVSFSSKWTGMEDGITFSIADTGVQGIKEAEHLLRQMLESVSLSVARVQTQDNWEASFCTFKPNLAC